MAPVTRTLACGAALAVLLTGGAVLSGQERRATSRPVPVAGPITPVVATEPVTDDADDPAVWVNTDDPARSLIFGTNKVKAPAGSLVAFGLDGKTRQVFAGLDRPNNVDVEKGLVVGGRLTDVAVVTERLKHRLRVFAIARDGSGFTDVSSLDGLRVFPGRSGEASEPMGIGLYRRRSDGAIFAIVSPKTGPRDGYLQQYRLEDDGSGKVRAVYVRSFGRFSGSGEIEAVAVDDLLGYVYYADEGDGIHKYSADPDAPDANRELAHFGTTGFAGDREGIAIYQRNGETGYIVCTDQVAGNSEYHVYRREGAPGRPHDHSELVKIVSGGADATDGIEIESAGLPGFPKGLLVAMNSKGRNFLVYRWEDVATVGTPALSMTEWPVLRGTPPGAQAPCEHDWSHHNPAAVYRSLGPGDTLPKKIRDVAPSLPGSAGDVGGVVIAEVLINEFGHVESACVLRGLRADVDSLVLAAVRQWLFEPARSKGKPVPVLMTVTRDVRRRN
jgi:3-phytase